MKSIRLGLLTAALALIAGTATVAAAPATVTANVEVYAGPSDSRQAGTVSAGQSVDVGECRDGRCNIQIGLNSVWVAQQYLVFGAPQPQPQPQPQFPQPQPQPQFPWPNQPQPQPWPNQPPRPVPLPQPVYEDAGACFFSERNFRGNSFCMDADETLNRLRTWNDSIRSVQVFGGAEVDVCADQNLYGSCATLNRDTGRLPRALDRNISSIDVY